jgi:hypothetical protein
MTIDHIALSTKYRKAAGRAEDEGKHEIANALDRIADAYWDIHVAHKSIGDAVDLLKRAGVNTEEM